MSPTATLSVGASPSPSSSPPARQPPSIARVWVDLLLSSIRKDFARPTVHARNLFHVSAAMWDAWATYDVHALPWKFAENHSGTALLVASARVESIAYAAYTLVRQRFKLSPGWLAMSPQYEAAMSARGFKTNVTSTAGNSAAAIGLRVAQTYIFFGIFDGSRESTDYDNSLYESVNSGSSGLDIMTRAGNPFVRDITRWQPVILTTFVGQGGQTVSGGSAVFLSPQWGSVKPFAMTQADRTMHWRMVTSPNTSLCASLFYDDDDFDFQNDELFCRLAGGSTVLVQSLPTKSTNTGWPVYSDPGAPPVLNGAGDAQWRAGHQMVALWSGMLSPLDTVTINISPGAMGNSSPPLSMAALSGGDLSSFYKVMDGGDAGTGYSANPATGLPYAPNIVLRGDYARVLAEFFADGPTAETPPGHWFVILHYVRDSVLSNRRMGGAGEELNPLEFDVKAYFALGGAMHDTAIAVWGAKGW